MFTAHDYRILSDLVFRENYPGYRPNVVESPNGDGKWDGEKRYAHIADKYLKSAWDKLGHIKDWNDESVKEHACLTTLSEYMNKAHVKALEVAVELGVPKAMWPNYKASAMRVLEYPPGSVSHEHTDFDLFTLMCYRNIPEDFRYTGQISEQLQLANQLNRQIHFGEILELVNSNFTPTGHKVIEDAMGRTQYSIVYFALPSHDAVLPDGQTVGEWLEERYSRSRKET